MDSPEYLARIRNLGNAHDPLQIQQQTAAEIARMIAGVDDEHLRTRSHPDKWCVTEIIAHLAEDEISSAWRYRQMIESPGITLNGFNQDLWGQLGHYRETSAAEWLELFRSLRSANVRMLSGLTEEQWQCHGIHTERGRITVRELAAHMAGHDRNHVEQIRGLLKKPIRT